jgi:hypothetical protein
MTAFRNSRGTLNKSTKKTNPKAPDFYGSLTIDEELARYLVGKIKGGEELVKFDLSGWKKESEKGSFISLSLSPPYVKTSDKPKSSGFDDDGF